MIVRQEHVVGDEIMIRLFLSVYEIMRSNADEKSEP